MTDRTIEKFPGKYTQTDLSNDKVFQMEYEQDAWGNERAKFSDDLLALSAELAICAYTLDIEQWWDTDWVDFTFQVDNKLYALDKKDLLKNNEELLEKESRKMVEKAKANIHQKSLIKQFVNTVKQREESSTGKALLMGKKITETRFVIGVGFMGTGDRVYDWISNFRFESDQGIHKGFYQLTKQFMSFSKEITFPAIAQELGLNELTLAQIIEEAKSPYSRFLLWSAGHSQGAAILQLWTYFLMEELGVDEKNMIGYGLASPLVMTGLTVKNPGKYPIYHILNSDDFVGVVGGQVRLGIERLFYADDTFREKCYAWKKEEEAKKGREAATKWLKQIVDMPTALQSIVPFVKMIIDHPKEEQGELINILPIPIPNNKIAIQVVQSSGEALVRFVYRRVNKAYQTMTGVELSRKKLREIQEELQEIAEEIGTQVFIEALNELITWPHFLQPSPEKMTSAYLEIVKGKGPFNSSCLWLYGKPPTRSWRLNKKSKKPKTLFTMGNVKSEKRRKIEKTKKILTKQQHYAKIKTCISVV
ncbi:MAG: lipase family protein [Clostridiales bacterium]|nr:lipase family protein [Clostridiales bacterium]